MANFSFDTSKVGTAISDLSSAYSNYKSIRSKVTEEVMQLGSFWQGQSYTNFKNSYDNYETELEGLDAKLEAFLSDLTENNANASKMIQEIEEAMN